MTCPQDDKRMEGLRILARMIAAAYRRRTAEGKTGVALPPAAPTVNATPASRPRERLKHNATAGRRGEGHEN